MGSQLIVPYVNKIIELVNKLIIDIKTQEFDVDCVIIFGSVVRHELCPTSDIDICIVAENAYNRIDQHNVWNVQRYIDNLVGTVCDVDYVICTHETLFNRDRVFNSIMQEGRVLWQRT